MNQAAKTYAREFVIAMVLYIVLLISVVLLLRNIEGTVWRALLAVLPVIPVGFGMSAFIRFLNRMDELQQRIQLAGIAFAAGAVGMLSFTYGFLELAGFPRISWLWIFPALIMLWGLGVAVASRRYQ